MAKFLQSTATLGSGLGLAAGTRRLSSGSRRHQGAVGRRASHGTGYLPMYHRRLANWLFRRVRDVVKIVTIETGGGHTNAGLSGQAFALHRRSPSSNAFAKAKGASCARSCNCVYRGNVYLCAAKGHDPKDTNWPAISRARRSPWPLRRHAQLDHALSAGQMAARRQART